MRAHRIAVLFVVATLLATGCGDDTAEAESPDTSSTSTSTSTTSTSTTSTSTTSTSTTSSSTTTTEPATTTSTEPVDDADAFAFDDPAAYYLVETLTPQLADVAVAREGAIVRGTQDAYVVDYTNCCTDDTLYVNISSLEDNAVVAIYAPDGTLLASESTAENLVLDQGGEFWIVVGSVRGNASYTIEIGLAQNAS